MAIQIGAFMMRKSICKDFRWISTVTEKVAVFAKIVSTTQRESIVTNVNRNIIDHMENTGMKPMCANVCNFLNLNLFLFVFWIANQLHTYL